MGGIIMDKKIKLSAIVIVMITAVILLAACFGGGGGEVVQVDFEFNGYPIEMDVTLEYWMELNTAAVRAVDMSQTNFAQELMRQTGVNIRFLHPPAGQHTEQFNILVASGNLPDIMEFGWLAWFPGGPERAIAEDIIVPLNDVIPEHAPNLARFLDENPEIARMVRTDTGSYYVFPFIRGDELLQVFVGPVVRQDWLDALGLDIPETINDWEVMLAAFRDEMGADSPLTFNYGQLHIHGFISGAFGVRRGFFVEDGEVRFGALEPGYREYLETMARWFADGLFDRNFATTDNNLVTHAMLTGGAGASLTFNGSGLGVWMQTTEDPNFRLSPAPYPVRNRGDMPMFGQRDFPFVGGSGNAAITTSSRHVALAARVLDFGFSEAGHNLFNFGIEGESFDWIDGYPTYTDLILNNPDFPINQAMGMFLRAGYNGPFVQDRRYAEQFFRLPEQQRALEVWQTQAQHRNLPPLTPTPEESAELARIMNNVNTFVEENTARFIMGLQSFDDYERFLQGLRNMGIERAIEIQNAAYQRFLNR